MALLPDIAFWFLMDTQSLRHTLLFVDDEPDILQALERAFRKRCRILLANSGSEAIALLDRQPVDLIISDQRMPGASGVQVLKHALSVQPEAVRILLTGYADVESLAQCVNEAQIYKYITKPWQPEMVLLTVYRALENLDVKRQLQRTIDLLQQQKSALDHCAMVSITDSSGVIKYVNDKFCAISGYTGEELRGNNHRLLRSDRHNAGFFQALWNSIGTGNIWRGEVCNRRKNGGLYWLDVTIVPLSDAEGQPPGHYVSIAQEIFPVAD